MEISQVAVVGAGLMGTNIALDFALRGFRVRLTDAGPGQLARSRAAREENLGLLERHGMLVEPGPAILERVEERESLAATAEGADLVVEAVSEVLALKQGLFRELERLVPPPAILASNTSSLMPSWLAEGMDTPERVLVAHYWNPAHLIPLVELVPGPSTEPETVERMRRLYEGMGKRPAVIRREVPGFIGNRLQFALYREALALVQEGVATPEDIDAVVRASFARRLPVTGLFGTMDLAGLDVMEAICRVLFPGLAAAEIPPPALSDRVAAGRLGVKTGAGWYDYAEDQGAALRQALMEELIRCAKQDRERPRGD